MRTFTWIRLSMMLAVAAACAFARLAPAGTVDAPAEPGPFLQAGAALRVAIVGRHALTHENLPGSVAGLVFRPDRKQPFNRSRHRNRVHDDGLGYAAGDSLIVTALDVGRREIVLLLGLGGYDPRNLEGGGKPSNDSRQQALDWQIRLAAAKYGIPTNDPRWVYHENLTDRARETRVRELENQRGDAIKASEDAAVADRQMMRQRIARVAGSRIRIVFDRDIPLADLNERRLRDLLAPYLTLAD